MKNGILFLLILVCFSCVYAEGWETLSPSGDIPSERYGHCVAKIGDILYIFGGRNNFSLFNDLYIYNKNENSYELIDPEVGDEIPSKRYGHTAVVYYGKIYIFGGMGENSIVCDMNDIWEYNPTTNLWDKINGTIDPGNDLPDGRYDHQSLVLGTTVYISGGYNHNNFALSKEFWTFDLDTKIWLQKADMKTSRYGHSMFMDMSSRIYVYAGKGEVQNRIDELLDTMERYDSQENEWDYLQLTNPPVARMYQATLYTNNNLWILGGRIEQTRIEEDTNQLWHFDIATASWSQKEDGPTLSRTGAAILDATGSNLKMFIFGGQNGNSLLNQTWKYDSTNDDNNDNDNDGDDDDDDDNTISCGATGIEFLFFFVFVCVWRACQKKS